MKRASEDVWGPPRKKGKGSNKGVSTPWAKYVFKALCNDSYAAGLLGTKGAMKDEIQQITGTKLVFSNRDDYFPETRFRVLGIYADDPEQIAATFEHLMPKLIEAGDEEKANAGQTRDHDHLGKGPGEYCFRFCITARMASHIIGSAGCNIKQIRAETGAKLFVENETIEGHRTARAIGDPDSILKCMHAVHSFIQQDVEEEDYYHNYASVINFRDAINGGWTPVADPEDKGRGKGHGSNKGDRGDPYPPVKPRRELPPPQPRGGKGGKEGGKDPVGSFEEGLHNLADIIQSFPEGTAEMLYSVTFSFSTWDIEILADRADLIPYVERQTSAEVKIEEGETPQGDLRAVTIVGSLLNVYVAHALLFRRLRDIEEEERRQESAAGEAEVEEDGADAIPEDDVEAMKAKIAELQAKLAMAQT